MSKNSYKSRWNFDISLRSI